MDTENVGSNPTGRTMIIPMSDLKQWDVYENYIPESWNQVSPRYQVYGVSKEILLVRAFYPNGDQKYRFVKIFYNYKNYCNRVVLKGRVYPPKTVGTDKGVQSIFSPPKIDLIERLTLKAKRNPIVVNPRNAL